MIRSFAHAGLKRFFESGSKAGIQPHHATRLQLQLGVLNQTTSPQDMAVPSWRLHKLTGNLSDHWSVTVSGNWRLTFRFDGCDVILVDYQDYH